MAVAAVLGDGRTDLRWNFLGERADDAGLVPQRSLFFVKGDSSRCLREPRGCGRTGEKAVARAVRGVACGDRRTASRPEPGARKTDGDYLVQGALQPRRRRSLRFERTRRG